MKERREKLKILLNKMGWILSMLMLSDCDINIMGFQDQHLGETV